MPKVVTEQMRREKALRAYIAKGQVLTGLQFDKDLAERIGESPSTFSRYRKTFFANLGFWTFCRLARELEFTGREVCEIIGIPYEGGEMK